MNTGNIRLLQLVKTLEIGGIERSTILYSNHLTEKIDFVCICAAKGFYDHSNIVDKNVKLFNGLEKIEGLNLKFLRNLRYLLKVIRENNINIVHYHHRIFSLFIPFIKIFYPEIKIVYTAHNVFDDKKNLFLPADSYIAVSKETKSDLQSLKKRNVTIIPHGIETEDSNFFTVKNEIKNIGYVGRFEELKGIFILLEAFKELSAEFENLNLILRGDGRLKSEIMSLIKRENLSEKVTLDSPKYKIEDIYRDIDLLILPAKRLEGFGLVLIEAMKMGIPVIGTNVGGIKSIINNEENGLLIEPNTTALINAIKRMMDFDFREKIITNAYNEVLKKYNIIDTVLNYISLLETLKQNIFPGRFQQ